MLLKLSVLFLTPLISGLLIFLVANFRSANFKLLLVFAGAYLFGITVVHILPELYRENQEVELIGLFVLIGFFLQQVLEYFSSGVEHGHIHTPHDHHEGDHHHHHHHPGERQQAAIVLLLALCVHAFLEGGMLATPANGVSHYDLNAILLGIALHRAPAAFALMTVLSAQLHSRTKAIPHLLIFSVAAPAGLLLSTYFVQTETLSARGLIFLYALVSGNFLHISTTIVFESSPDHRFHARKLAVAIVGALAAVAVEYMIE
ncbi:MAG TPA: ZIP family metal transporter [Cyclobacteriaceae bacterium]|nr:ZIP family metal transporter [Cyclobacteriaceae bacterium]